MKFKHFIISIALLGIFISAEFQQPASAGILDFFSKKSAPVKKDPPFPIDEAGFLNGTKRYSDMPFKDPKYEFEALIPKNWKGHALYLEGYKPSSSIDSITQSVPTDLIEFKSPIMSTQQATINIQSFSLGNEIHIGDWLEYYISINGYNVEGDVEKSDSKASASFTSFINGQQMYTRITAYINHNIILIARFDTPYIFKESMNFLQKRVLDSFKPLNIVKAPIEEQTSISLNNALKVNYPKSWSIYNKNISSMQRMKFQLHNETIKKDLKDNEQKKLNGLIKIEVIRRNSDTSLLHEIDGVKQHFDQYINVDINELISSDTSPAYARFIFSRYEIYKITPRSSNSLPKELHFVALGDKEWYILAYLYTPSKKEDLYTWARNVATFDLIIKNMK